MCYNIPEDSNESDIDAEPKPLGPVVPGPRGFELILFDDHNGHACSLQQSSLAEVCQPGASAVWLGVNAAKPQIMASKAATFGIETKETTGWVPYPIPPDVLLTTRMHLSHEQVRSLIVALQQWVETGTLSAL